MAYDKNTDYQAIINEAVAKGDYVTAAKAEQSRNEKIADLNKAGGGTNEYGATATNKYSGWLDTTDYGTVGKQQMASGASAQDVYDTYISRHNKASGTEGLQQYVNDDIQQEMWDYIQANLNKEVPTFDYDTGSKPSYSSNYSSKIDEMLNQILNRDAFSYDAAKDPLYAQYQTQYEREGNRAMNDTLASVASQAGGMNSYAVTAAQQANDYHMAQMTDKIPELYQMAYEMYLTDIDNQVRDLGLLQDMDNTQYGRYRDTMSDWRDDRDFAYQMYRDQMGDFQWDKNFNTTNDHWQQEFDAANNQWQQEFDFETGKEATSNERYDSEQAKQDELTAYEQAMEIISYGGMPTDEQLKAAGLTREQAQQIIDQQYPDDEIVGGYTGGGSDSGSDSGSSSGGGDKQSGGGGYDNGGLTTEQIKQMQRYYGVTADGKWGANSTAAAGGKTAKQAWADWQSKEITPPAADNDDDGGAEPDWNSALNLGIGPISASYVVQLIKKGAVIENADGSVKWAPGYDASNYEAKLANKGNFTLFGF